MASDDATVESALQHCVKCLLETMPGKRREIQSNVPIATGYDEAVGDDKLPASLRKMLYKDSRTSRRQDLFMTGGFQRVSAT